MAKDILDYSKEELQAQFHDLRAQREAILAVSTPLREERDAFASEAMAKERALNDGIREAEKGLFDIDRRSGAIARLLNGNTGKVPSDSAEG